MSVCYQPYNLVFVACKVKQLPFLFVIAVAHIHNFAQAILRNLDLREGLAGAEIADVRKMQRLRIGAYFKMTETGKKDVFPAHRCLERKHVLSSSKAEILDAYKNGIGLAFFMTKIIYYRKQIDYI